MWDFNLKDIGRTLENLQDLKDIKQPLENLKNPVQDSIKRPVEVMEQIGKNINDFFEPSLEQKKDVKSTTKTPGDSGRAPEDKISPSSEVIEQAVTPQQQQINMLSKAVSQLEQAVTPQQQQINMLSKAVSQLEQAVTPQQQQINMLSKAVSQLEQAVTPQQQQINMLSKAVSQLTDRQEKMRQIITKNDVRNKIILSFVMGFIVIGTLSFVGQTIASNFLVQSKNTSEISK